MEEKDIINSDEPKSVFLDDLVVIYQRVLREQGYNLSLETCRVLLQSLKATMSEAIEEVEPNGKIYTPLGAFMLRALEPKTKRLPTKEVVELPYRTKLVLRNHRQMDVAVKKKNEELKNKEA